VRLDRTATLDDDDDRDLPPTTEDTSRFSGMDGGTANVLGELDVDGGEEEECG